MSREADTLGGIRVLFILCLSQPSSRARTQHSGYCYYLSEPRLAAGDDQLERESKEYMRAFGENANFLSADCCRTSTSCSGRTCHVLSSASLLCLTFLLMVFLLCVDGAVRSSFFFFPCFPLVSACSSCIWTASRSLLDDHADSRACGDSFGRFHQVCRVSHSFADLLSPPPVPL